MQGEPDIFRARTELITQAALAMSRDRSDPARPLREVRISLGLARDAGFQAALSFANGGPPLLRAVERGEIDLTLSNPAPYVGLAVRGTGPFGAAAPLRLIGVIPSWDRIGLAIAERTGIGSLGEVRDRRYPLRLSIRRTPSHSSRFVIDRSLGALGFSLDDIVSWGGSLVYADTPTDESRLRAIADGSVDAVFDEGVGHWGPLALAQGMRLISVDDVAVRALEELGWPSGPILPERVKGLWERVVSPSFSGYALVTRDSLPDEVAYRMCASVEEALPHVAFAWGQLSMDRFCADSDEAPLTAPLHPGAERFYRERGLLPGD